MISLAEASLPTRLVNGVAEAGELFIQECKIEQQEEAAAVGMYPSKIKESDELCDNE